MEIKKTAKGSYFISIKAQKNSKGWEREKRHELEKL